PERGRRIAARLVCLQFARYAGLFVQDYDLRARHDCAAAVGNGSGDGGGCPLSLAIDAEQKQKHQYNENDFVFHGLPPITVAACCPTRAMNKKKQVVPSSRGG